MSSQPTTTLPITSTTDVGNREAAHQVQNIPAVLENIIQHLPACDILTKANRVSHGWRYIVQESLKIKRVLCMRTRKTVAVNPLSCPEWDDLWLDLDRRYDTVYAQVYRGPLHSPETRWQGPFKEEPRTYSDSFDPLYINGIHVTISAADIERLIKQLHCSWAGIMITDPPCTQLRLTPDLVLNRDVSCGVYTVLYNANGITYGDIVRQAADVVGKCMLADDPIWGCCCYYPDLPNGECLTLNRHTLKEWSINIISLQWSGMEGWLKTKRRGKGEWTREGPELGEIYAPAWNRRRTTFWPDSDEGPGSCQCSECEGSDCDGSHCVCSDCKEVDGDKVDGNEVAVEEREE